MHFSCIQVFTANIHEDYFFLPVIQGIVIGRRVPHNPRPRTAIISGHRARCRISVTPARLFRFLRTVLVPLHLFLVKCVVVTHFNYAPIQQQLE